MDDFTFLTEQFNARIYIRSWRPGDGLACAYAKRAPVENPCAEPVAVVMSKDTHEHTGRYARRGTKRVVCRNHIPGIERPGDIGTEARKAAAERLIVEHWADYQRYIDEETQTRRNDAFEFADPEIRRIVLGEGAGAA